MPFIPHTKNDISHMLDVVGVSRIDELFDEIPDAIRSHSRINFANGINECQMNRLFLDHCAKNMPQTNFIGAGAYQHYTPAAVIDIITRGEFYTSYTPYQAEASQGTLQVIYEYQTMMASLTGMEISNASMYDGATALAEAILMAVRANKKAKSKKVLIADSVYPHYIEVVKTVTESQGVEIDFVTAHKSFGISTVEMLQKHRSQYAAVVLPQVNFYGQITRFDDITNWAHDNAAMVIALVNPMILGLLKAPGHWGHSGADIACGDGQPLGLPLSAGGPYFGFITAKSAISRQMPGRIVGKTVDIEGQEAFCLTLQAREQHIRRAKATSNICSNQGLLVTAATVYMSLMGAEGLKEVTLKSHENLLQLMEKLKRLPEVKPRFDHNFIYETVIELPVAATDVLRFASERQIELGVALSRFDKEDSNALLICTTEIHNESDLDRFVSVLEQALTHLSVGV
ncbi:MAG: aminomethyl-transferring glycine dehydrogenase subunit GcvPA [Francisellaceae bacterium]